MQTEALAALLAHVATEADASKHDGMSINFTVKLSTAPDTDRRFKNIPAPVAVTLTHPFSLTLSDAQSRLGEIM